MEDYEAGGLEDRGRAGEEGEGGGPPQGTDVQSTGDVKVWWAQMAEWEISVLGTN